MAPKYKENNLTSGSSRGLTSRRNDCTELRDDYTSQGLIRWEYRFPKVFGHWLGSNCQTLKLPWKQSFIQEGCLDRRWVWRSPACCSTTQFWGVLPVALMFSVQTAERQWQCGAAQTPLDTDEDFKRGPWLRSEPLLVQVSNFVAPLFQHSPQWGDYRPH